MAETSHIMKYESKTSKQEKTYLSFDYQYETTFIHSDPKDDTSRKPCEYQRQLKNQHRWSFFDNSTTWRSEEKQEEDQRNISKRPSVKIQLIDVIAHQSKDG